MTSDMDIRICFVGDSFVNGTGDPEFLGWTGRVCQVAARSGYVITGYNLGIRRDTSADIAARWEEECSRRLLPEHDARIVFSFGANDTMMENGRTRLEVQESRQRAEAILLAASVRFKILFVGPPPVVDETHNERIGRLDEVFQEVSSHCGVPYRSVFRSLKNSADWMTEVTTGDGAHPGSGGYTAMAKLVIEWPDWWFRDSRV